MENILDTIGRTVLKGDYKQVVQLVTEALDSGLPAVDILEKGLVPGVQALGDQFKDGQVYLPEVLISTRAMTHGVEELKPHLADSNISNKGTIVLGTVKGDLHDIGKNLVGLMLSSNGFEVIDIGVDVAADAFVRAAQEHNADIIAMSGLLTTTIPYFADVVRAIQSQGLDDRIKIMIGGAPVTRAYADEIKADGFADNCASAVDEAGRLIAQTTASS